MTILNSFKKQIYSVLNLALKIRMTKHCSIYFDSTEKPPPPQHPKVVTPLYDYPPLTNQREYTRQAITLALSLQ